MLKISVHDGEQFNEETSEFVLVNHRTLEFEHSLSSISKWESEFNKPFISETEKTPEESLAYFYHMLIGERVDLSHLTTEDYRNLGEYVVAPMTATVLTKQGRGAGPNRGEFVTAELIYYYMVSLNIPFECDKWHFNRLLTLIQVTNIKNQPAKKMSRKDAVNSQRAANEARMKQLGTTG